MDVASMGWMAAGMGLLTAPFKELTAEIAEDAEEADCFASRSDLIAVDPGGSFLANPGADFLFVSALSASFAVIFFLFFSSLAIASASQRAFTLPREAGRLL